MALVFAGILIVLGAICLLSALAENNQAMMPFLMPMEFTGEYSYDGEEWYPYDEESDLSATHEKVILRGHLNIDILEGSHLNLYCNHVGVSAYRNGELIFMDAKTEISQMGIKMMKSMCGQSWNAFVMPEVLQTDEIEIHLINVHKYHNENAYRELLSQMYITEGFDDLLVTIIEQKVEPFNIIGGAVLTLSALLIGAAITSFLMKGVVTPELFQYGLLTFFVGGYILLDNMYIFDMDEIIVFRTYGRQLCMMISMFLIEMIMVRKMSGKIAKVGRVLIGASFVVNAVLLVVSIAGVLIYDTQPYWIVSQMIVCPVFILCSICEIMKNKKHWEWYGFLLLLISIVLDYFGIGETQFNKNVCFKVMFALIAVGYIIRGIQFVIMSQHALVREKKLQAELTDLRIATMLSQIKPHFIYNTLGTIEQFCVESPEKAKDLVHKFALYLRGNFVEIGNAAPIRFAQEIEHVKHYVSIEEVRFPDMQVCYDIQTDQFLVPALTVQPLVENAIKHGLMGLETGGKVEISTYEKEDGYYICVKDDGVGFDESAMQDGKKHIGIQNIRTRIESMCDGSLTIDSIKGVGTTATIWIPKEEKE